MQLLDTVTNGDLDDRVVGRGGDAAPGRRRPTLRTTVSGRALAAAAQVAGAAALAEAHRLGGRPAAAAHAADAMAHEGSTDMVGSETVDDDDGGDEFERARGRNLDARAAEVSQPGWEPTRGRGGIL